jgi:hypothetical protein
MGFIESAKVEGAQLRTGGGKPGDPSLAAGLFIAPTVFDQVTPAMRIGREEIFGPVMSVMPWDDYEDMLAKVNGVEYGLTAAIVTNDLANPSGSRPGMFGSIPAADISERPMAAGSKAASAKRNVSTKSSAIRKSRTSICAGSPA